MACRDSEDQLSTGFPVNADGSTVVSKRDAPRQRSRRNPRASRPPGPQHRRRTRGEKQMARLADRVAIVTGAGRPGNIGLAVCEAFLREGATAVVATDMRTEDAAQIAAGFDEGYPDRFLFLEHDVASEASWRHVLDITLDRFGGLDVLV